MRDGSFGVRHVWRSLSRRPRRTVRFAEGRVCCLVEDIEDNNNLPRTMNKDAGHQKLTTFESV